MLDGRLQGALEGAVLAAVMFGIFYVVALIVRLAFKKRIDTASYYTIAVVLGFVLHRVLISVLSIENADASPSANFEQQAGLDAPFLPPSEDAIGSFPEQLHSASMKLPAEDRKQLNEAISFLGFSYGLHMAEQDPSGFDVEEGDLNFVAKTYTRLYRFAQQRGSAMTLRHYMYLVEEMKHEKPEWWAAFLDEKMTDAQPEGM